MSVLHDDRKEFRLERAIHLDLNVPQIGVAVYGCLCLFGRVGIQTCWCLKWTASVDKSGFPYARTNRRAAIPLVLEVLQLFDVVAHIANAGYAAGNIEEPIQRLGMSMHIKETGQHCLTSPTNSLSILGNAKTRRWADHRYASLVD